MPNWLVILIGDIHYHNACLFGIHEKGKDKIPKLTRDLSKRLIYCVLCGGGAKKTGSIIAPKESEHKQYEKVNRLLILSIRTYQLLRS